MGKSFEEISPSPTASAMTVITDSFQPWLWFLRGRDGKQEGKNMNNSSR